MTGCLVLRCIQTFCNISLTCFYFKLDFVLIYRGGGVVHSQIYVTDDQKMFFGCKPSAIPYRLDLYTPKSYQTSYLMIPNVLNERQKMNDDL